MMLKSSIILVLLAVAASCHFKDEFQTIGRYERPDKTSKTWYLSTGNSTWLDAVERCKTNGMKLATFGSDKEEADKLLNFYNSSSNSSHTFIGYTDEKQEGTFTTFECEILQIELNFHINEPNNGRGVEHCLEIFILNNVAKYNDINCNTEHQFICELENNCQSCDRVNKDNIQLQTALSKAELSLQHKEGLLKQAELNLQRKNELYNVEKSKHEEILNLMQNNLSESNLILQYKERLVEVEKSLHKETIKNCTYEINSLKRTILQLTNVL